MDKQYNLRNIRTLLIEGFTTEELRWLCFDEPDFRPVYDQLAEDTGKSVIVNRLLEYAASKLKIEAVLALAKERTPAQYEKHQPYDEIPAGLTLSSETHREPQMTFTSPLKALGTNKIKILFLASNPQETPPLKLDEEIRSITQKIRASEYRDVLELISLWAVRPDDLLQALNEHRPTIVHFSGHGSQSDEIILMDNNRLMKSVSSAALKMLFATLKDNIRLVVLNACYSEIQAKAIAEVIDNVIGMNTAVGDDAAIAFAASFYRAIGFGRSIREAFDQGKTSLLLEGIPEENTPQLLSKGDTSSPLISFQGSSLLASSTEKLVQRAIAAINNNDYDASYGICQEILNIAPTHPEANLILAVAITKGKNIQSLKKQSVDQIEMSLRHAVADPAVAYTAWAIWGVVKYDFFMLSSRVVGNPNLKQIKQALEEGNMMSLNMTLLKKVNASSLARSYFGLDILE